MKFFSKGLAILPVLTLLMACNVVMSQTLVPVTLRILNEKSGEPLPGATVTGVERVGSFLSDSVGLVKIFRNEPKTVLIFRISSVGFEEKIVRITEMDTVVEVLMNPLFTFLQEIVFSASRTPESILRSPVSVEKMNHASIRDMAAVSLHDELRQIKGIELISTGLNFKQVNSRGFANTFSWRFLQLTDDMDNMSPALGFSLANIFSAPELDVASVELIPGAASALYGPVAFNGLLHTRTRDPFTYTGLSVQWKSGFNHINEATTKPQPYNEFSLRYAQKLSNRLAFKVSMTYMKGLDFFANDSTDVNTRTPFSDRGPSNPARDGLNIYGDEVQRVIPGIGLVSRTGYHETSFANYQVYTLRTNAALHYRINNNQEIILQQNYSNGNANFTGTSRFCLMGVSFLQSKIEWKGSNFFIRGYRIGENLGDSYNTRSLSQLMNQLWVTDLAGASVQPTQADDMWFRRYETAYKGGIAGIGSNDHTAARSFADQGRWLPGSPNFELAKDKLIHTYEGKGAAYYSRSAYYQAEGQYSFKQLLRFINLVIGGNIRRYDNYSRGTLYADKLSNLQYNEYGIFMQGTKELMNEKLKLTGSLRLDKNPNFKANFSPRISGVYALGESGFLRASYQTGFRNPSTVEQFINIKIGQLTLLGGAPRDAIGKQVYQNSFTSASVESFLKSVTQSLTAGINLDAAIENNKTLLKQSRISFIRPELQHTYEIGFRGEWLKKFVVDFNIDYSTYYRFSVNAFATRPVSDAFNGDGTVNLTAAREILNNQSTNYQLYTNSSSRANAFFASAGISYFLNQGYRLSSNFTYSRLIFNASTVANEIAPFNTPPYTVNLSFSNSNLLKNTGFRINWHWQDTFEWVGTFNGNRPGRINSFSLIDLSFQHKLNKQNLILKAGANNLLNHKIMQAYGSPRIGSVYYLSMMFDTAKRN